MEKEIFVLIFEQSNDYSQNIMNKTLLWFLFAFIILFHQVLHAQVTYTRGAVTLFMWQALPSSGFTELPNGDVVIKGCLSDNFGIYWQSGNYQFFDSTGNNYVNGSRIEEFLPYKKVAIYKMPEKTFQMFLRVERNVLGTIDHFTYQEEGMSANLDTLKMCLGRWEPIGIGNGYAFYDANGAPFSGLCEYSRTTYFNRNGKNVDYLYYSDLKDGDSLRLLKTIAERDSCLGCYSRTKDTIYSQKIIVKLVDVPSLPDIVVEKKLCPFGVAVLKAPISSSEINWYNEKGQTSGTGAKHEFEAPEGILYKTKEVDSHGCNRRSKVLDLRYDSSCSDKFRVQGKVYNLNRTNNYVGIPNLKLKLQSREHDSQYAYGITDSEGKFDIAVAWVNTGSDLFITDSNYFSTPRYLTDPHMVAYADFQAYLIANNDVEAWLSANRNRPGFTIPLTLSLLNKGKKANKGQLKCQLDAKYAYVSSSLSPSSASGNTLTWNLDSLYSNESKNITVYAQLAANAVLGSTVSSTLTFTTAIPDDDLSNNTATTLDTVRGSWDPNDKAVKVTNGFAQNHIKDSSGLEYVIRFQNMGTDTAFIVVVKDVLSSDLDFGKFEMLDASHSYSLSKKGDTLAWRFANILLPDNKTDEPKSHGFVRFKIQPKKGSKDGVEISNQAAIYFDFNEPVITNTVLNTLGEPWTVGWTASELSMSDWRIFPNPSEGKATVQTTLEGKLILFDVMGRQVWTEQISGSKSVEFEHLSKGLYHFQFQSEGKVLGGKLLLR